PLVIAYEKGFLKDEGLSVELMREPGWATIRDKLVYGELEGAHALAGLAFAISWGIGVQQRQCVSGYLFNTHGDGVTLSNEFAGDEVQLQRSMKGASQGRKIIFGIPHALSSHHFILRRWLSRVGLDPGRDVELLVLPPALMPVGLEGGHLDGYCVGEPYNTEAVRSGYGKLVALSSELCPMHPEKAFLVSEEFAELRSAEHEGMIRAFQRAGSFCESEEGREEAARILSRREYLHCDFTLLCSSLIEGIGKSAKGVAPRHVFHDEQVNRPTDDKAEWITAQMTSSGLLDDAEVRLKVGKKNPVFRSDIFDAACKAASPTAAKVGGKKKQSTRSRRPTTRSKKAGVLKNREHQ
ncbi:MAG: CmpA/NrtA family ABC transporter substrate-binding protein, partial [Verrucomicrobiota bacterium]